MQYNLEMLRQKIKDENKDYRAHKRAIHKAQDRLLGILEEAGVDTRVYIDAFEVRAPSARCQRPGRKGLRPPATRAGAGVMRGPSVR